MTTIRKGIIYIHSMYFSCKLHIVQVAITRVVANNHNHFHFRNKPLFEASITTYSKVGFRPFLGLTWAVESMENKPLFLSRNIRETPDIDQTYLDKKLDKTYWFLSACVRRGDRLVFLQLNTNLFFNMSFLCIFLLLSCMYEKLYAKRKLCVKLKLSLSFSVSETRTAVSTSLGYRGLFDWICLTPCDLFVGLFLLRKETVNQINDKKQMKSEILRHLLHSTGILIKGFTHLQRRSSRQLVNK